MTTFSISAVVQNYARRRSDAAAITEAMTGRSVSWSELDSRVEQVVGSLVGNGIRRGDRVVYWGHNCIEFFELYFGTARIGATFVPLNWNLNDDEIASLTRNMGAAIAFADSTFASRLPGSIEIGPAYLDWRTAGGTGSGRDDGRESDVVVQPYTSGTTGVPKGVMLTNGNVRAFVEASRQLGYDETATHMLSLPNYHIGGCVFPLLAVAGGGQVVIVNRFTPPSVLDTIEEFRITHTNFVPTMINMVLDEQERRPRDVSSLRLITYGAAPVTSATVARAQHVLGVALLQEYASTEAIAITVLAPHEHTVDRLASVGRPFPGVEVQIRDISDGRVLVAGEPGEICVRSEQCTKGYWRLPEETARLTDGDGFIRTGDLGYLDAEGLLYLTGRLKDMIVTGGENIYPAEVEAVLEQHEAVAEVAVVGLPDERWGEIVAAFVVLSEGHDVDTDELKEWSNRRLSGYRRPRQIHVVPRLPRNPTGKIERQVLRSTPVQQSAAQ